jgi:hypothetical protein
MWGRRITVTQQLTLLRYDPLVCCGLSPCLIHASRVNASKAGYHCFLGKPWSKRMSMVIWTFEICCWQ